MAMPRKNTNSSIPSTLSISKEILLPKHSDYKIGIDVGGTFTDFVVVKKGGSPKYFKTSSTPHDPSEGIMSGLKSIAEEYQLSIEMLLDITELIIHGTTVATNTLVERKGAKVGLITTEGFRDLLEMREGLKEDRYNLHMKPVEPLVARHLRIGIAERLSSSGEILIPLDEESVDKALDTLEKEGVESLAVCFLFSFLNPEHEKRVLEKIAARFPKMYTSLSHQIIPQIKEFDRLSTTAINSYVGPAFGSYLSNLKERLCQFRQYSEILIMQSNGGVAPIEDSISAAVRAILSGPAGGVNGAAHYGQLIGESKIIGLDIGGTSTDISLIEDGKPHVTNEKFEAGWKIAVPMIDIQTQGAGGGSIARIDEGGILRVGPDSAGAHPGPACYQKGGSSPTVTDANLLLGYLDSQNFLGGRTQLDIDSAEKAMFQHVAKPLGLSTIEASYGIHEIVSTNITEGVRLMSVKRGVDPRDFVILGFGGASGLHVSKVARQLQIGKVYIPAAGPVLSAYGMLSTDLRYDFSRSYPIGLHNINLETVRSIMNELELKGHEKLSSQGIQNDHIEVVRSADMRYLDQIYEVNVPMPTLDLDDKTVIDRLSSNFHRRYDELYSYHQSNQEIRLVNLRISVIGHLPKITQPEHQEAENLANAQKSFRKVYLGSWVETPIYDADKIPYGSVIPGPAIIESCFTTILIEEADTITVDKFGGMELRIAQVNTKETTDSESDGVETDPITLAVVENRLESIALEMKDVMLRTSMSQILNSSHDFSTAILDTNCQLIAQGEGIPVHVSALPIAVSAIKDYFGDDINDGDMFALNDPYFGGSHLPDITIIRPVFFKRQLVFYTVNRAHHSDVGGATHGGYNPAASEIYHEGLRIPPVKIYDQAIPRKDLLQLLSANVRHPKNFIGDLNAQIGSVNIAAQRIISLLEDYGPVRLKVITDGILAATERQVRQFISDWPDGVYKGESLIDDDGFDSKMIPIRATVTIDGTSIIIDLGESNSQVKGFINSSYANTRSLSHVAIMYMAPANVAKNEGSIRPVKVIAPRGLIVNANPPAPVCMSTNHCAEEIIEAIFKALASAVPYAVNAGFSRRLRYAITGLDPRTGRSFIWHFFLARGGGGASQGFDGWSNVGEVQAVGGIRAPSVEITEDRFPFLIKYHEMRPDSGGDGEWRGGVGSACELVYQGDGPAILNTAGDGIINPPFGLFGGQPGKPHIYSVIQNGKERFLRSKEAGVIINPGDSIVSLSSGGGGFGDPAKRSLELREYDIKNGYCT